MAVNSLFPGFVKLFYNGNSHPHIQIVPMGQIDASGASWDLKTKDGSVVNWVTGVTAYANVEKAFLNTADEIVSAELWRIPSVGADPIFAADTPLNLAGTNVAAAVPKGQMVVTYRTTLGGLYRNYLMETAQPIDTIVTPPFASALLAQYTYLVGATSIVVGRDGGYLSSAVRMVSKLNDALRKKFFLNV